MSNQEFPESFTLELRARHFKHTRYQTNCNCAVSKAAKDVPALAGLEIVELVNRIDINGCMYDHEPYMAYTFLDDKELARSAGFNDTIIRTIKMTRA